MSADPTTLVDEDASSGSGEDANMNDRQQNRQPQSTPMNSGQRKRGRKAAGDAIVDAMLEIAAASKMRATSIMKNEDRFSISKCIKVLDEMKGVNQRLYFFALDLFENPNARETFIALKMDNRSAWLQGKFNISAGMDDCDLELDEMELVAAAAGYYYYNTITREPSQNASRIGTGFMNEILNGNDDTCREMFRMDKHVFCKMSAILRKKNVLRDTPGVMIEEQLAIFLNIVGHNERNRVIQERYQHSGETISRHFNNVLRALKSLSREFLEQPPLSTPSEILSSNRFHPYFKDCIGVIDGMHLPAHVPSKDHSRFRNKKGVLSQNVLAACTFDMQFIFIYPGWEGSVSDSRVLRAVLDDPDQKFPPIPEGNYYLVDSDYSNMKGFIGPYPGVRYHLHEYRGANLLPRNAKELFNHRLSSLQNTIQKSFQVLKTRFPILKVAPQYAFHIQRDIVIAACVLHNHVRREEKKDWLFVAAEGSNSSLFEGEEDPPTLYDHDDHDVDGSAIEQQAASSLRDSMATAMWNDFIHFWDEW